jgi:tRNA-dihydrouridine synthase
MQLYGSDAEILAKGAEWCAEHGATVVDINMGCPVDKVTKKDGGSKLMCDLDSTFRTFERVRRAMPEHVPLTAKMRLGWSQQDADNGVAGKLAIGLIQRGAAMITVHGRTTEQRFKGSCSHEGIRRVVEMVAEETGEYDGTISGGVPVIGNGDIKFPIDIVTMMNNTKCAGVMIGRGSFGDPWLFRVGWILQQRVAKGADPERVDLSDVLPSEEEKLDMLERFFARMVEHRDEAHALHVFRQRISLLGKRINGGHCKPLKNAIREAKDSATVLEAISDWRARAPGELV